MNNEYVWVIGFNKDTGERDKFIRCAKNNSSFYAELYNGEGLDVKIFTSEELDEIIEHEKKNKE